MIDLHCHLLPGVDDGAQSLQESVAMCRLAAAEGCEAMVATPHQRRGEWWNADRERLAALAGEIQARVGPGLRVLLKGWIRIETQGASHEYGPFEWWYETGPDPVFAAASETEETAFVRVLVLPSEWAGKRTIRYVDPADEDKPKLQRARIYLEQPL